VHIPLIAAFAVTTALMSFLRMPCGVLVGFFLVHGLFSQSQSPVAYSKAIAAWFDKDRGLALGVAISGVGIRVAIIFLRELLPVTRLPDRSRIRRRRPSLSKLSARGGFRCAR
jgi:hypothetical protein